MGAQSTQVNYVCQYNSGKIFQHSKKLVTYTEGRPDENPSGLPNEN
jgi:hypothetical protein